MQAATPASAETRHPGRVGAWAAALRPRTLAAGAVPVLVAVALAWRWGAWDAAVSLACLAGALLLQVASNFANDAFDYLKGADTAARVGPARATQQGWLSARQMLTGTAAVVLAALCVGGWLVARGGWPIAVIGLTGAVCAVAYTGGPRPLGYLGLGDLLVFVYFGLAAVGGTVWLLAPERIAEPGVWLAASAVGALASAILVVNNLRDRHTDAAAGKRTLAVRIGPRATRAQWAALVAGAFSAVALAAWESGDAAWLLPWLSAPLAVKTGRAVRRRDGAGLNPLLGETAKLETVFGLLLSVGLVASRALSGGAP